MALLWKILERRFFERECFGIEFFCIATVVAPYTGSDTVELETQDYVGKDPREYLLIACFMLICPDNYFS